MAEEVVQYGSDAAIATITLNRPHRLNAWTGKMNLAYRAALSACLWATPPSG